MRGISFLDTILRPEVLEEAPILDEEILDNDEDLERRSRSDDEDDSAPGIRLELKDTLEEEDPVVDDSDGEGNYTRKTEPKPEEEDWFAELQRDAERGAKRFGTRNGDNPAPEPAQAPVNDWMAELERDADRIRGRGAKRTAAALSDHEDNDVFDFGGSPDNHDGDRPQAGSKSARRRLFMDPFEAQEQEIDKAELEKREREEVLADLRRARQANREHEASLAAIPRRDYTRKPAQVPSFRARTSGNTAQEVYFPIRGEQVKVDPLADLRDSSEHGGLLAGTSIYRILDEIDAERAQLAVKEGTRSQLLDLGMEESEARKLASEAHEEVEMAPSATETQMWTDKYRPRLYTDLIGDETVNRSVLSWVKAWDYCVFQRKAKAGVVPGHEMAAGKFRGGGGRGRGSWRGGQQGDPSGGRPGAAEPKKDRWHRPENKVGFETIRRVELLF